MADNVRLRPIERRRLVRLHRSHTRPSVVQWFIDGWVLVLLYVVGYIGAASYWATLNALWDPRWVGMFAPLGHAIPALVVGVQTGRLYRRGRYFFLVGPTVLVGATFLREVWLPHQSTDVLTLSLADYWIACAEGLIAGGIAMAIGASVGASSEP